jgi:hypothetical protein
MHGARRHNTVLQASPDALSQRGKTCCQCVLRTAVCICLMQIEVQQKKSHSTVSLVPTCSPTHGSAHPAATSAHDNATRAKACQLAVLTAACSAVLSPGLSAVLSPGLSASNDRAHSFDRGAACSAWPDLSPLRQSCTLSLAKEPPDAIRDLRCR